MDEGVAMHDDRDGHACTWDLFEAHAQNEARDSVGRIGLEWISRGKATGPRLVGRRGRGRGRGRGRVGAPMEDGVLSG